MNKEMLREILNKIPWTPLFIAYLAYLGWGFYQFMNDTTSPYQAKLTEMAEARKETELLEKRVQDVRKFIKEVDVRQTVIQAKSLELEKVKNVIPEKLDLSEINELLTTEAAKSRIQIIKREFGEIAQSESGLYSEMAISVSTKGVFQQFVGFLNRIASAQRILRVESVTFVPISSSMSRFVMLEGKMTLKAYKYQGSKADQIGRPGAKPPSDGLPASANPNKGGV